MSGNIQALYKNLPDHLSHCSLNHALAQLWQGNCTVTLTSKPPVNNSIEETIFAFLNELASLVRKNEP